MRTIYSSFASNSSVINVFVGSVKTDAPIAKRIRCVTLNGSLKIKKPNAINFKTSRVTNVVESLQILQNNSNNDLLFDLRWHSLRTLTVSTGGGWFRFRGGCGEIRFRTDSVTSTFDTAVSST